MRIVMLGEDHADSKSRSVRRDLQQAQKEVRDQQECRERFSGKEKAKSWER